MSAAELMREASIAVQVGDARKSASTLTYATGSSNANDIRMAFIFFELVRHTYLRLSPLFHKITAVCIA